MRVGQRLFLAVVPAVIGVLLVAALAYWGAYERQAPAVVVWVAGVASLVSLAVAFHNTRYVARRIETIAAEAAQVRRRAVEAGVEALRAAGLGETRPDELESIEMLVQRLAGAAVSAEQGAQTRVARADERAVRHDALLREAANDLAHALDDIRLPLHILLENRFGDLNENQEEMLGSARNSAEAADERIRRVTTIIAATDGTLALRHDRLRGGELVDGLLTLLRAEAEAAGIHLDTEVAAPLPALTGDRAHLQKALRALFSEAMSAADRSQPVRLQADAAAGRLRLRLSYTGRAVSGMPLLYGRSLIVSQGGEVRTADGELLAALALGPPDDARTQLLSA